MWCQCVVAGFKARGSIGTEDTSEIRSIIETQQYLLYCVCTVCVGSLYAEGREMVDSREKREGGGSPREVDWIN